MSAWKTYVKRLHEDEDVVDSNRQHKKRDDLDYDQRRGNPDVTEKSDARHDGHKDDDDAREAKQHLRIDLRRTKQHTNGTFEFYYNVQYIVLNNKLQILD